MCETSNQSHIWQNILTEDMAAQLLKLLEKEIELLHGT